MGERQDREQTYKQMNDHHIIFKVLINWLHKSLFYNLSCFNLVTEKEIHVLIPLPQNFDVKGIVAIGQL